MPPDKNSLFGFGRLVAAGDRGPGLEPAPCNGACRAARTLVKDNLVAGWNPSVDRACRDGRPRSEAWLNADPAPRSERGRPLRDGPAAKRGARAAANPRAVMQPPPGRPVRDGWPRAEGGQNPTHLNRRSIFGTAHVSSSSQHRTALSGTEGRPTADAA